MRNLNRIRINYKKLKVTEPQKAKHEIQLLKLKELAPYGSWLEIQIEPQFGKIRSYLKVKNKRHCFTALTLTDDIDSGVRAVIKDIDRQLLSWKRSRFDGNTGQAQVAIA